MSLIPITIGDKRVHTDENKHNNLDRTKKERDELRQNMITSQEPIQRADGVDVHMFLDFIPELIM